LDHHLKVDVTTKGVARKVNVDKAFIEKSIYEPDADIATGYAPGVMKSYKGIITKQDIDQIDQYIKDLK
jgi:hypothetical protein